MKIILYIDYITGELMYAHLENEECPVFDSNWVMEEVEVAI